MSIWDVFIFAMIFLAIFRGYLKGICRRLSSWVGLVLGILVSIAGVDKMDSFFSTTLAVDGKAKISAWLEEYFASRISAGGDTQINSITQWIDNLYLPDNLKESIYSAVEGSANEVYVSIYSQVANVLSAPLWHMVLLILGSILIYALCILVGELMGGTMRRFKVTNLLDRFLGAILSGFLAVAALGVFTSIAVFIVPESAGWLGRALHASFLGPMLSQAMDVLLKGGLFF